MTQRSAEQIPSIPLEVAKYGDRAVRLDARRRHELHASGHQPAVRGVKIIDAEEEADAAGELVARDRRLAIAVGAREQDSGDRAGRPDDNPSLRAAVVRQRGNILDEIELQDVDEEVNRGIVFADDECDEVEMRHRGR